MGHVHSDTFGTNGSETARVYTLTNANGMVARVTNYGATLTELHAPDRDGNLEDVVLGFDNLDQYTSQSPYFGCTVGRVANRVAEGQFVMDNRRYQLATNDGPNHLHGGERGFDGVMWEGRMIEDPRGPAVRFTYTSANGEEGYPGNVDAEVVYVLSNENELFIEMQGRTDARTPLNMAHHSYWNLAGPQGRDVLDHEVMINAAHYTPVDETMIPTGERRAVVDTPFDFTQMKPVRQDMHAIEAESGPGGYDHNFALRDPGEMSLAARVREPSSGRMMEIYSDQPGMQFYTGNFLNGSLTGKDGAVYGKHAGMCFETQGFPDAVNQPNFPSVILEPGQTYRHRMVHRFYTDQE